MRIFDISDIRNPKQVAAEMQTCHGSHTHTLVFDPNDKENVYIYVSGTSFVRRPEELAGCSGEAPDRIQCSAVGIRGDQSACGRSTDAKIVSRPRCSSIPRPGALNGRERRQAPVIRAKRSRRTPTSATTLQRCTPRLRLAAGACSGNGILLDIKDPVHPKRLML